MSSNKLRVSSITNVLIAKLVGEAYTLGLMLDGFSVDNSGLELLKNAPMDCVALVGMVSIVVIFKHQIPDGYAYEVFNCTPC